MASKCFESYIEWTKNPRNVFLQGTFQRGADSRLFYMLAQTVKYLMREPQPWFRAMLDYHLPLVGIRRASSSRRLIYVQDRGEIAKYREYYNTFGCHTIDFRLLADFAMRISRNWRTTFAAVDVAIFISGNTPFSVLRELEVLLTQSNETVESTWRHPSQGGGESARWGASSPAASWIDLYAGVSSSGWVCIVQSNWCRMINFLRLTSSRASCAFVDVGIAMLGDAGARKKYCVVKREWPTKAFSNVLVKRTEVTEGSVCV
jgi:hypothetical protein